MNRKSVVTQLIATLGLSDKLQLVERVVQKARSLDSSLNAPYDPYRVLERFRVPITFRDIMDDGFTARVQDLVKLDCSMATRTETQILNRLADNPFVVVLRALPRHSSTSELRRRRFTAAHEMAHVLLRTEALTCVPELDFLTDDFEEEDICNRVASEFLLPADTLRSDFLALGMHCDSIEKLLNKYAVSLTCLLRKAIELYPEQRFAAGIYQTSNDGCASSVNYITPTDHRWIAHSVYALDMTCASAQHEKREPLGRLFTIRIGERLARWYCESLRLGAGGWTLLIFGDPEYLPFDLRLMEHRSEKFLDLGCLENLGQSKKSSRVFADLIRKMPPGKASSPALGPGFAYRRNLRGT
jgi:hypothetical protein